MMEIKYRRVLLKLSGEALVGEGSLGISPQIIDRIAEEIYLVSRLGVQVCIVVGGGNIFRGLQKSTELGMDRAAADYVGMLATVMNCLVLQGVLEKRGMATRVQTALTMNSIAEPYVRRKAQRHLEKGRIVIFGAGTGNPFFTTDTAASLRATEMDCDLLMTAKNGVDGVYSDDPKTNPSATKYDTLSYDDIINKNLKIMDTSAIALCRDNSIPIAVFDFGRPGAIRDIIYGMEIGTLVQNQPTVV
ncbi:MAG: UMP kinase [Candidatus Caenarcaniphilales bacterium]|nr:UMP kinase [Candidatus Caenarcaniphilales bacterium]